MTAKTDNVHQHDGKFDLQKMLQELAQQPQPKADAKLSQSDISALFQKKKKGADK